MAPNPRRTRWSSPLWIVLFALIASMAPGGEALAQDAATAAGDAAPLSARVVQTFLIVTVLSLAPGIAMMITCLPFMIVVLGILRQAIGLQQSPPNMMIVSLGIFLTFYVMEPVFKDAWTLGVTPYLENLITEEQAISRTLAPFEIGVRPVVRSVRRQRRLQAPHLREQDARRHTDHHDRAEPHAEGADVECFTDADDAWSLGGGGGRCSLHGLTLRRTAHENARRTAGAACRGRVGAGGAPISRSSGPSGCGRPRRDSR